MATYGYARAGADGPTLDAQAAALTAAGAGGVFRETAGGAKTDRRELARALHALESGDALLVTRLDRLARSTRDLLNILDAIAKAGAPTQADLARRFNVSQSTISRLAEEAAPQPARPALDTETEGAARAFMQRLEGKYPAIEGIVFGSRARGDHRADSDTNIAVILKGENGDRYKVSDDMAGIAFDVLLETGILVQALPLWEGELKHPERFGNPALIESIKRDGLRL